MKQGFPYIIGAIGGFVLAWLLLGGTRSLVEGKNEPFSANVLFEAAYVTGYIDGTVDEIQPSGSRGARFEAFDKQVTDNLDRLRSRATDVGIKTEFREIRGEQRSRLKKQIESTSK